MAMEADEIRNLIVDALPGASVTITDLAGDGDHYSAEIVWDGFADMSRIAQHQRVYAALQGRMGGELHALQLKTRAS